VGGGDGEDGCLPVLSMVFNIFDVVDVDCLKILRFPSLLLSGQPLQGLSLPS